VDEFICKGFTKYTLEHKSSRLNSEYTTNTSLGVDKVVGDIINIGGAVEVGTSMKYYVDINIRGAAIIKGR